MSHKFDPKNKKKLDNEWRREVLPPIKTLEALGLQNNDIVADIGCGIGYFTIPITDIVSRENKIFGLDTSEEMLEETEKRALLAEVSNVITINTKEYDLKLPSESVTFALVVNVLHEIEDKNKFLIEVSRILKPEGKIAIIEWEKEIMDFGPPVDHRLDKVELNEILTSNGFRLNNNMSFTNAFYGLVGEKMKIDK